MFVLFLSLSCFGSVASIITLPVQSLFSLKFLSDSFQREHMGEEANAHTLMI